MEETENQRLKIFRTFKKCTQQQFADIAKIKQGTYADQERGKVGVSGDVKLALFKEFSLNIDWLETGVGEMTLPDYQETIENLKNRLEQLERSPNVAASADYTGYEPVINWQQKFIDVDEKYKALLENRLVEFLKNRGAAGRTA